MKLTIAAILLVLLAYLVYYTNVGQGVIIWISAFLVIIAGTYFIQNNTLSTKEIIAANAVDVNSPEFEAEFREKYKLGAKDTRTDEQYLADLRTQYGVDN